MSLSSLERIRLRKPCPELPDELIIARVKAVRIGQVAHLQAALPKARRKLFLEGWVSVHQSIALDVYTL